MTNTHNHARREFDILIQTTPDAIIRPFIPEILALCEKFGLSGQSGGSAPTVAMTLSQTIKHLLMQEPICPIAGIDSEWMDVTEMNGGKTMYQNIRCSALFKDGIYERPYFIEAIIFRAGEDNYFTSNTASVKLGDDVITSKQQIKSFPFEPVRFFVDVISTEWADKEETVQKKGGGWWTHVIKDPKQLEEVFAYYDKYKFE